MKVHDELPSVLNETSFLFVEIENSMVQISKDLSIEPVAKYKPSLDSLDYYILEEKIVVSLKNLLQKFCKKLH